MKRWNQHVYNAAKKSGKGCRHFWNAIRKYGKDAFSHEVLEKCGTVELANRAEEKWIAFFDTKIPARGFNLTPGGSHTPHPVASPWDRPGFREKVSGSLIGRTLGAETRAKIGAAHLGRKLSPEHVAKVTGGRPCTAETKEKLRLLMVGRTLTIEQKAKVGEANRARTVSRETRIKLSKQSSSQWSDPKYVEKTMESIRKRSTDV